MSTPDDQPDLTGYITKTEEWIHGVLDTLGWTRENILEEPDYVPCPVDDAHKMPVSALGQHLEICPAKKKGYSEEELKEDKSSKFFYEKSNTVMSVDLDDETLVHIISSAHGFGNPVTVDDLPLTVYRSLFMLSQGQRLAIYEHCLNIAKSANHQTSIPLEHLEFLQDSNDEKTQKSLWELKAEERDQKRRRQSYKGNKSVSTKHKSHLQIIQEVINNQTELLTQKWKREKKAKRKEEKRKEKELNEEQSKNGNGHHRHDSEERHSKSKHKKHKKHKHKEKSKHRSRSRERSEKSGRKRSRSRDRSQRPS